MSNRLTAAAEHYFADLQRIRASGGATSERSVYTPIANLLNAVGGALKPKVFCIGELADQGAGHPDFGLYAARQVQKGRPRDGQTPECGVVEVKSADADTGLTAASSQVSRYRARYRVVLVTNTREFVLLGEGPADHSAKLETFQLAADEADFDRRLETPRAFARQIMPASGSSYRQEPGGPVSRFGRSPPTRAGAVHRGVRVRCGRLADSSAPRREEWGDRQGGEPRARRSMRSCPSRPSILATVIDPSTLVVRPSTRVDSPSGCGGVRSVTERTRKPGVPCRPVRASLRCGPRTSPTRQPGSSTHQPESTIHRVGSSERRTAPTGGP